MSSVGLLLDSLKAASVPAARATSSCCSGNCSTKKRWHLSLNACATCMDGIKTCLALLLLQYAIRLAGKSFCNHALSTPHAGHYIPSATCLPIRCTLLPVCWCSLDTSCQETQGGLKTDAGISMQLLLLKAAMAVGARGKPPDKQKFHTVSTNCADIHFVTQQTSRNFIQSALTVQTYVFYTQHT